MPFFHPMEDWLVLFPPPPTNPSQARLPRGLFFARFRVYARTEVPTATPQAESQGPPESALRRPSANGARKPDDTRRAMMVQRDEHRDPSMVEFKAPTVLELLEKDLQWATQEFGLDDPHVRAMKTQLDEMRGGSALKPVHFVGGLGTKPKPPDR